MQEDGMITVLTESGEHVQDIKVEGAPQITGLWFSKQVDEVLYATETTSNRLLKISLAVP